jgi:hypothetical protein
MIAMRTTLHIDDDIFSLVKDYAETRNLGIGKAISDLARRGLTVPHPTRTVNGLLVFDLPEDSPRITSEHVKKIENEI